MIDIGVTISSLDLVPCLPDKVGFKFWPKSFAQFDAGLKAVRKLPKNFIKQGQYLGCSSLFSAWSEDETTAKKKLERLEDAAEIHRTLCALSAEDVPFALLTEPVGINPDPVKCGPFGRWKANAESGQRIAKACQDLGLSWIMVSQNRLNDDDVAAETIELASCIQAAGVEVTLGWQCWPGWGSTECISTVQKRIREANCSGLSGTLSEIGFRYSRFVNNTREGLAIAKIERDYSLSKTADWIDSNLDATDIMATWWQGNLEGKVGPNLILPRKQIKGIDLSVLLALDSECDSLGSDRGGGDTKFAACPQDVLT